jgi:DNA-directed RNA polymerase specialized sigma24 family protein
MQGAVPRASVSSMAGQHLDTQSRLHDLPERHLAALRAALSGFEDPEIASLLEIPMESVRPTLRLAAAKLAAVLAPGYGGDRASERNYEA